jgi:VCBS repeat-containing protein
MVSTPITADDAQAGLQSIWAEGPDATLTVPDTQLLFSADFKRAGPDLILSGQNGPRFVVHDYFKWDKHPTLWSADGARLDGALVDILAGPEHPGQYAQAAPTPGPNPIGRVEAISGSAAAVRGGVVIQLNMGDVVYQNDVIQTGSDSSIGFALLDGSVFKMSGNARMVLNDLVYDPNGSSNSAAVSLVQGTISFLAGQAAHTGDMKVTTPVSTMGIRGTAVNVTIQMDVNGQVTSVTCSMMDNGIANLYNAAGNLIGTLTNNGNALVLRAIGQFNVDVSQVAKTAVDITNENANLQQLGQVLSAYSQNPIIFQQAPTPPSPNSPNPQNGSIFGSGTQFSANPLTSLFGQLQTAANQGPISLNLPGSTQPISLTITTQDFLSLNQTIISSSQHAGLVELSNITGSTSTDQATGSLTVSGINPTINLTVTAKLDSAAWSGGANIPAVTQNDIAVALTPTLVAAAASQNGTINLNFSLPDHDVDFLAKGETLTLTYSVTLTDQTGKSSSQPVTITITGTNDLPVITSSDPSVTVTETPAVTASSNVHIASGTLNFIDADLTDRHSLDALFFSAVWSGGSGIPAATLSDLQKAIAASIATDSTGTGAGTINWTFNLADHDLDFLAAGQTLTVTYQVDVTDQNGGSAAQYITVTITGTNDLPVISSAPVQVNLVEASGGSTSSPVTASGKLNFSDVDLSDHHTASATLSSAVWSGGTEIPATTQTDLLGAVTASMAPDSAGLGSGALAWNFSLAHQDVDFLADGDTLTLTYLITVKDPSNATSTQSVTITVTGAGATASLTELPDQTGSTEPDAVSGTLDFADVGQSNHTATVISVSESGNIQGLPTNSTLLGLLTTQTVTQDSGSSSATVPWSFSAQDKTFDYLATGETVILTYTVQLDGQRVHTIAVTITGTNDAPVITTSPTSGGVTEDAAPTLTTSGTMTFQDVDLIDTHSAIFVLKSSDATANLPGYSETAPLSQIGTFALTAATVDPSSHLVVESTDTTNTANVGWSFTLPDTDPVLQSLALGQVITQIYTVTVTDNNGLSASQDVTVTITGTNDAPVLTADASGPHTINELSNTTGSSTPDITAGTLAFIDLDLTDTHTPSYSAPTFAWSGGVLTTTQQTALTQASTLALTEHDSTDTGAGSVGFTYSAADSTFDFLAAGQTLTITYDVTVTDINSASSTQQITITVNGANEPSALTVTSVTYTLTNNVPGKNEIDHNAGNASGTATITLHFSEDVTVTGIPTLSLNVSDVATYVSGSGTNALVFTFTPSNSGGPDRTTALAITAVNGTITDAAGNNADTTGADVTLSPHLGVNEPAAPAGVAGDPINLALTNPSDGQDNPITVTFTGVPSDWSLNQGTNVGNGTWTVETNDVSALTIKTPAAYAGAVLLSVTESWTKADGSTGIGIIADNVEAYAPGSPIFALAGDDTLTGAGANDLFVFAQPIGNDTIYNFNVGTDKIDLLGFAHVASFSDIQLNIVENNGDAVITVGAGETITLHGVDVSSISANDFVFNQTPIVENDGNMVVSDGAILPLGGTVSNTGTITLSSMGHETDLQILANGATLQGGGHIVLSDNSANMILGDADPTLTNLDNTITGAGQIGNGHFTLVNAGTIDADGTNALVIDTGTNVVTNSGTLEATGSGGLAIRGDVLNTGMLWANDGHLTVNGAVTGDGDATITASGTLEFAAASDANLSFATGADGALVLDQSSSFTGKITGLQSSDSIDLKDIDFGASTTASYVSNNTQTGGTLTVSDGVHSANIALVGDYSSATWTASDDSHGGTSLAASSSSTVVSTAANEMFTGSAGDTFLFAPNFGHDTITNFQPEADSIQIDHSIFPDFAALLTASHDDGHGNVVITADPNDTVTLKNVTVAQIQAYQGDFHFT